MSRLKLLVTNVGFFGGLKVLSSLFPLFILPYVTRQLNGAEEFGIYDIFIVISSLSASIAMMGIQDAMFRQYHLKNDEQYRKDVTATGFLIVTCAALAVSIIVLLLKNSIQSFLLDDARYYSIIYFAGLYVITQNLMNISVQPSRLANNKKHLLINTLINAVVFYAVVILLLQYSFGVYALIYAHFATAIFIAIFFIYINRKSFFPVRFSKEIANQLIRVGLPLMPIFLIYWANNSIVRVLIMKYLGAAELGIFAIGSKYASVSTFIQMAFAGGWSFFTYSTMNDVDQVKLKSKIFDTLLFIIVLGYALLAPLAPYFFELVFTGDYIRGFTVFGQLFLAPLFLILYQIIANQFTIVGKSHYSLISLGIGFIICLIMSLFFLERGMGIVAVSYSIPISYLIAIIISYLFAKKQKIFNLNIGSFISFGFIILVNLIIQIEQSLFTYIYLLPLIILFLILKRKIIAEFFDLGKRLIINKR